MRVEANDPNLEAARAKPSQANGEMKRKDYQKEVRRIQVKLCRLQDWVRFKGLRTIIVFEGRDAADNGSSIKALTERVSPRVFRVLDRRARSERERTQLFVQRYIERFAAAREAIIFDRCWYNRASVEYLIGFCTQNTGPSWNFVRDQASHHRDRGSAHQGLVGSRAGVAEAAIRTPDQRSASTMDDEYEDLESFRHSPDYCRARDLMLEVKKNQAAQAISENKIR